VTDPDRVKFFSTDPDDYEGFIKELQRIIEESPPGMQAKYARLINMLSKKRNLLKRGHERSKSHRQFR
jgi:hypothetical protein